MMLTDMSFNTVLLTWLRWFTGSGFVVQSAGRDGDNGWDGQRQKMGAGQLMRDGATGEYH